MLAHSWQSKRRWQHFSVRGETAALKCQCKVFKSSPSVPLVCLFRRRLTRHCTFPITAAANSIQPSCKHKPDQPTESRSAHAPVTAPSPLSCPGAEASGASPDVRFGSLRADSRMWRLWQARKDPEDYEVKLPRPSRLAVTTWSCQITSRCHQNQIC